MKESKNAQVEWMSYMEAPFGAGGGGGRHGRSCIMLRNRERCKEERALLIGQAGLLLGGRRFGHRSGVDDVGSEESERARPLC